MSTVVTAIEFLKDKILRRGDKGPLVKELQKKLKNNGYIIAVDGDYGNNTEKAVIAFQKKKNLVADGIAGPKTQAMLDNNTVVKKFLTNEDIYEAAKSLDIDPYLMLALNEVESKGTGFLDDGRPAILFERHIMYRELKDAGIDPNPHVNTSPGLVNSKTGGYVGGAKEWIRLENAIKIDRESALSSASWGSYQIMGFHWEFLGFTSVEAFVDFMFVSERNHLECLVRFIRKQPTMHRSLKEKQLKLFAELYNGKNHKQYDLKIQDAFNRIRTLMA